VEAKMHRKRWVGVLILISLIVWLTGCAHVMSSEVRAKARKDLSFPTVLANPDAYQGETVIWGGKVIETLNEPGSTLIKVLQIPLDYTEMPEDEEASQGRFMAELKGYADPEVYRKGRIITLAGMIIGKRGEPLSDMEYTYPLVKVEQIHLWKQYPLSYGPYPLPSWYRFGYPYGGYPYPWPYFWPYYPF
jgi:outer membrane lipoprotein